MERLLARIGYSPANLDLGSAMPLARKPRAAKAASKAQASKAHASHAHARPYHHGNLCSALLEAAAEAITERGVAELRLRDLARRIGVSHGAPANHFRDREDLLVALAIQGFERLTARQRDALEAKHATPAAALNAIGVAYVEFARDNPAHFEVMFQRNLLASPELARAAAACFEQLLATVTALSPKRSDAASRGDRELVALGAWGMVHGLATLHVQGLLPGGANADVGKITGRILSAMHTLGLSKA